MEELIKFEAGTIYVSDYDYDGGFSEGYRLFMCTKVTDSMATFQLVGDVNRCDCNNTENKLKFFRRTEAAVRGKKKISNWRNCETCKAGGNTGDFLYATETFEKVLSNDKDILALIQDYNKNFENN